MRVVRRWCEFAAPLVPTPHVVFDIDGTLLDGATQVKETVDLYHWCVAHGVTPVVITARARAHERETTKQLASMGVDCHIHFCDTELKTVGDVARYKARCRAKYNVIANIGDQWSDFGTARELDGVPRRDGIVVVPGQRWLGYKV